MKVIQVPYSFYPDSVGGTEIYVEALSNYLNKKGIETLVAAFGNVNESYKYKQLNVRRYSGSQNNINLRELYGHGDPQAALNFGQIVEDEQPDLIHLHAFTSSASLKAIQVAKQKNIPVVLTYHTPVVSCQRGNLMKWGIEVCDGNMDLHTCTNCRLDGLELDKISASIISSIPPAVGRLFGNLNLQGGAWTAIRMSELVDLRHSSIRALFSQVEHIVAVCNWVKDLLVINEVPPEKISMIRQGLCHDLPGKTESVSKNLRCSLKIAFLGRIDKTKGIHILIRALQTIPNLPIILDIYGIDQGGDNYQQILRAMAVTDPRINFKSSIPSENVIPTLTLYDLLAVPSQGLETGPMVILEAFAARVPVLGSNLGGIAELVQHGVNGLLVKYDSISEWAQAIEKVAINRELLSQFSAAITPPQTMDKVAQNMVSIYSSILNKQIN
jgi:glycosyltransferase involved in cell wall biosynthesis